MSTVESEEHYREEMRGTAVTFRGGRPAHARQLQEAGEALRVRVGGRLGAAASRGSSDRDRLLAAATAAAEAGNPAGFSFPAAAPPRAAVSTFDAATERLGTATLRAMGHEAVERVSAGFPAVAVDLAMEALVRRYRLSNSSGLAVEEQATRFAARLDLTFVAAGADPVRITASGSGRGTAGVVEGLCARALGWLGLASRRQVHAPRSPRLVLAPEAVAALLRPLAPSLDGLLAMRGQSPLAFRAGETILDPRLSLRDDGLLPDGPASSTWDGEGMPRGEVALIEDGVLVGVHHDLRSAAESGAASNGSSRRIDLLPRRGPVNWLLVASEGRSRADLLAQAGEALLVTDLVGDDALTRPDGSFAATARLAFALSGGEVVGPVEGVSIAGNLYTLLRDRLIAAGDDARFVESGGFPVRTPSLVLDGVQVLAG